MDKTEQILQAAKEGAKKYFDIAKTSVSQNSNHEY